MDETGRAAERLGSSIRVALQNAKLNVMALHKRTGISRETIYRIMRGQSLPSLDVLLRIAAELKVSPGALIDGRVTPATSVHAPGASDGRAVAKKLAELQARIERLERRRHGK
jgi:transcriptional regulator with XRE-family HTH domain